MMSMFDKERTWYTVRKTEPHNGSIGHDYDSIGAAMYAAWRFLWRSSGNYGGATIWECVGSGGSSTNRAIINATLNDDLSVKFQEL
jgi:hypothetical protein